MLRKENGQQRLSTLRGLVRYQGIIKKFLYTISFWAAEAAIRAEDYRGAGVFLIPSPTASRLLATSRLNYLRGRVLYASNDITTALNYWRRLIESSDRWARVGHSGR